jgi:PKD repeat protein
VSRMTTLLVVCAFLAGSVYISPALALKTGEPAPQGLTYVESSQGLIPPELEGGHTEVEMGDVNGDGNPDLVSIGDHGSPYVNADEHGIMVWFGDGTGDWSVYQTGDFGYGGIALGDVNNDGFVDVGYGMHHNYSGVDFGDQLLEVALGDGSGQNWTPWDDGLATNGEDWGMFGTDFADVDNDGDLDLGSISFGCCAGVHVYLNQGDGTWAQSFGFLGENADNQFTFGDVNGDGNADLAVNHSNGAVYLGDGTGGYALEHGNLPNAASITSVALGDANHDGRDELALTNNNGGVQVWTWLSPGVWQNISGSLPTSGPYEAVQLFDMDMDGNTDVAAFGTGQVRIWGGDGAGGWAEIASFTTPTPGYEQAFRVGGDVDHNGLPDIVLVSEEGSWPNEQNHLHFYKESSTPTVLEMKPVSPSGGESYRAGAIAFVDWISAVPSGEAGTVSLELSIHGPGGPWVTLASGLPNGGRYQWHIPADTLSTNEAYIRYTLDVSGEAVQALTPSPFNILGSTEEPISGLVATNDGPTILGETTILSATVVSGTNVTYEWDLGDGMTGSGAVVNHVYQYIGVYTATVAATNSVNLQVATTAVQVYEDPIVGLQAVNDSPTLWGDTTVLTATVISGTNVIYDWDLGDGSVSSSAVVSHVYPQIGVYTATVTATNSVSSQVATTMVEIYEQAIAGLVAVNDSPTLLGESTMLTATVVSGTNVIFTWDLGDGSVVSGAVVSHTYTDQGNYTATVTATNSVSTQVATTTVEIYEQPIAGLVAVNDGPTLLGESTVLTATVVSGTNIIYEWDLGDGTVVTGPVVTHVYPVAGVYTATVTASNAVSSEIATTTVVVYEVPLPLWQLYLPTVWRGNTFDYQFR